MSAAGLFSKLLAAARGKGLRGELIRSGTGSVLLKVGGTAVTVVLGVLLARVLGVEQYGVYAFVFGLITLLAVPAQLGLPALIVREVATYCATEDWGRIRGLFRITDRIVGGFSLVLAGTAGALTLTGRTGSTEAWDPTTLGWGLLLLPVLAFLNVRAAGLRGFGRVIVGQFAQVLLRPAVFLVLVVGALLIRGGPGGFPASTVMLLHLVASSVALAYAVSELGTVWTRERRSAAATADLRRWMLAAGPFALVAGSGVINQNTDLLLLGFLTTPADVGLYQVAVQGAALSLIAFQATETILQPYIVQIFLTDEHVRLQKLLRWHGMIVSGVALPIVVAFLAWGGPIVSLVFGEDFAPAATALVILSFGHLAYSMMGPVPTILNMTGHERDTAVGVVGSAVVNLALNLALIPLYGIEGAAAATAMSSVGRNSFLSWRLYRRTGLTPNVLVAIKHVLTEGTVA